MFSDTVVQCWHILHERIAMGLKVQSLVCVIFKCAYVFTLQLVLWPKHGPITCHSCITWPPEVAGIFAYYVAQRNAIMTLETCTCTSGFAYSRCILIVFKFTHVLTFQKY